MEEAQEAIIEPENTDVIADEPEAIAEDITEEESAPSEEAAESETEEKPKKGGVQKRIDELTRQRYEAEARAEQAEREAAELRQSQTKDGHNANRPTLEQYDYDQDAYEAAMVSWAEDGLKRQNEAATQAEKARAEQLEQIKRNAEINRKMTEGVTKYPDFIEVVSSPDLPSLQEINSTAFEAVINSDKMAEISYYLGKNPSEVYEFQNMPPISVMRRVIELESKLGTTRKETTNAPPPPKSMNGNSDAGIEPSPKKRAEMSMDEWLAWRNQQTS